MKKMRPTQLCYISVFTQPRPEAALPECLLISYIDPVNSMKNNVTATPGDCELLAADGVYASLRRPHFASTAAE